MIPIEIEIGKRVGKLIVLRKTIGKWRATYYECQCDCGNLTITRATDLKRNRTTSCGCVRRSVGGIRATIHGHSRLSGTTSTYNSWAAMLQRCLNENCPAYPRYGGRGIMVCDKWRSFSGFLEDMAAKPNNNFTIERLDFNGNYCKENCVWLESEKQGSNRSSCIMLTFNGKTQNMMAWAKELGIGYMRLRNRIVVSKWSAERALSEP